MAIEHGTADRHASTGDTHDMFSCAAGKGRAGVSSAKGSRTINCGTTATTAALTAGGMSVCVVLDRSRGIQKDTLDEQGERPKRLAAVHSREVRVGAHYACRRVILTLIRTRGVRRRRLCVTRDTSAKHPHLHASRRPTYVASDDRMRW